MDQDVARIVAQEKELVFTAFDEAEAFALGTRLRDIALTDRLPIIIDIRLWDRQLFYSALPGSAPANGEWARRKFNSVRQYHKCSYRMFLEQGGDSELFPPRHGLPAADFAIAGGAFPIRVTGIGAVGCVAVSGLPQRDDHNLVVLALAEHLGLDHAALALPERA